jgi:predicted RNA-binding Zn ribbon-like protein
MVDNLMQARIFEFTGGLLCLDFTNTVEDRPSDHPRELLNSYSDLVSWSQQARILEDQEAQQLLEEAARRPAEASIVLQRAVVLREAIYRLFKAVAQDASAEGDALVLLNAAIADTMTHAQIVPGTASFTWGWAVNEGDLDRILWPVVQSAADLLTSDELDIVRICASDDCDWLFLDTSKNHSRRWCDMKTCGNRAKARRHYSHKKGSSIDE